MSQMQRMQYVFIILLVINASIAWTPRCLTQLWQRQSLKLNLNLGDSAPTTSVTGTGEGEAEATAFVILGGSGDLAWNKIIPSLFRLHQKGQLPMPFRIVACSRSQLPQEEHRILVAAAVARDAATSSGQSSLLSFLRMTFAHRMVRYDDTTSYQMLETTLLANCSRKILYFSLPPHIVADALDALLATRLAGVEVVLEKPLGRDAASCTALLLQLTRLAAPARLVDHYLGKEVLASLPALRRNNPLIEHALRRDLVAHIEVEFKETNLLLGRSGYFEQYGIVRDILQNHLLQAAALLMMELPAALSAKNIATAKTDFLNSLRPLASADLILGQYTGYREEQGVGAVSNTSTYAACVLHSDSARWRDVPVLLKAGKGLDASGTLLRVHFRDSSSALTLRVQPDPGFSLRLGITDPTAQGDTSAPMELKFSYSGKLPDAYELVVRSICERDAARLVTAEEVLASWRVFDAVLQWADSGSQLTPTHYPVGSKGPVTEADALANKYSAFWSDHSTVHRSRT